MANAKKPTRKQKDLIKERRLNPENWMVYKNPPGRLHILHRHTGTKKIITYVGMIVFLLLFLYIPEGYAQEIPQIETQGVFTINSDYVVVDGEEYQIDAAPFINKGRTFVPVRFLAEAVGGEVLWDAQKQEAILNFNNGKRLIFKIGEIFMNNNGKYDLMDVTPIVAPPGRICLPARYVAEAAGYNVIWDEMKQRVILMPRS